MSSLHQRAKEVFLAALERPAAERAAFIAEACTGDEELRREIESLLPYHEAEDEGQAAPREAPERFAAGQVIGGRYRMVTRIGRGGMGDVWRADDLILQTPVALKVIHAARPDARARLLNEVRLARQITHPAVCRVFDVGEAEGGVVFYTMELVTGEDLASLVRRAGRVPSEKVVGIARQLSGGLVAAHARGVLHRDLKPANILIDNAGQVRITDFGIAIFRADADLHMLTGTPGYMAPEQRTAGATLSERTDLYALGVVLYELVVGRHPFPRSGDGGRPPSPSTVVRQVDPQLEQIIMRSLSADPQERPASAMEIAEALTTAGGSGGPASWRAAKAPRSDARRWLLAGAAVVAIAALAGVAAQFVSPGGGALTERDTIVIADFQNATDEPVFDRALKVALAIALEQSPFLKVFPDDRARETLRLMQRSPEERLTPAVAREIARREQLKALLTGSIASLGRNYVLTIDALNAETGEVMAREQEEARSKEDVLTALGAATSRLRQKLGESLASIQKFDVPLPRATTASIDALHAYALALPDGREVPRLEAVPHLKRAIELDPSFALAHAQLSGVYTNTGQSALAPQYSRRAFELRERVSERERFFISWRYYRDAVQDTDKALELARAWTATYSREAFAFNGLGAALIRVGRFEDSLGPFRDAIRLDPQFSPAYSNLAGALFALGRYDEARATLQQATGAGLDFNGLHRLSYLLAFVEGDDQTMARELKASLGVSGTNAAYGWQAHTFAFAGRTAEAHEQFRQGIQLAHQGNFPEVAAQLAVEDAEVHAIAGQCVEARAEVAAGLAPSRDNEALERASRALALCGASGEAQELLRELARRFPDATLTHRVAVPITTAILALNRREPLRALQVLEPVRAYDHAPSFGSWSRYLRGQAYLQTGDGKASGAEFQAILEHRGEAPVSMLYALAHAGLARVAALDGNREAARSHYDRFFALWRDADPTAQPLKDAHLEYARLTGAPGRAGVARSSGR
jgi:tetratricopeptide (TPR) repeat protein